jgi:uncharacterized protein YoxC
MKNTERSASNAQTTLAISPEMQTAIDTAQEVLRKRRTIEEAVQRQTGEIAETEMECSRMEAKLADMEVESVLVDAAASRKLTAEVDDLAATVGKMQAQLRRRTKAIAAMEAKAAELDEEIQQSIGTLNVEAGILASNQKHLIAEEIREAVKPLRAVLEKARAIGVPGINPFQYFLLAACIPDPDDARLVLVDSQSVFPGQSLLTPAKGETHSIEIEAIRAGWEPIRATLQALKACGRYVPLNKRAGPYQIKGTDVHGRQLSQSDPEQQSVAGAKSAQQEPSERRASARKQPTPQELNPFFDSSDLI